LEQESRTRAEGFSMMARELEALQGALDAEAAERAKGLLNIGDRLKSVSESVNLETKERSAAVETMTRLVVQAKEEVEKGAKERKIGEEDAERTKQELKQLIQLEKADRDREDNSLRMQMANVREDMSFEKECHSNAISSLRSALQLSDIKNEERHKGIQDDLRMEIEDRINSHEKFDKEGMDLRTGIAADRVTQEAAIIEVQRSLQLARQALDLERTERVEVNDECNRILKEQRSQLANLKQDVSAERREQIEEITVIRSSLMNYDRKVEKQFQDFKTAIENEVNERVSCNDNLEKRFSDLMKVVITTVRSHAG